MICFTVNNFSSLGSCFVSLAHVECSNGYLYANWFSNDVIVFCVMLSQVDYDPHFLSLIKILQYMQFMQIIIHFLSLMNCVPTCDLLCNLCHLSTRNLHAFNSCGENNTNRVTLHILSFISRFGFVFINKQLYYKQIVIT